MFVFAANFTQDTHNCQGLLIAVNIHKEEWLLNRESV